MIRDHWWPTSALIHGGRSSLYALGSPPGRFGGRWEVALRNPFDPRRPLGRSASGTGGWGPRATAFQRFEAGGPGLRPHPRPPDRRAPGRGPASVTVLAPTAAEADALSTAFYLLGPDAAAASVAGRPEVGALFVDPRPAADASPASCDRPVDADDRRPDDSATPGSPRPVGT